MTQDLCTCACAERHTHVNCVTVSMSDVVFENYPQVGDVLELVARPVLTGRTSLDIALTVSLERNGIDKQIVCEASFVYVTVRGPEGEKRFVPPLPRDCHFDNERSKWETLIAQNRRNLLKIERDKSFRNGSLTNDGSSNNLIEENNDGDRDAEDVEPPYDLESREVVLPYTQNHMVSERDVERNCDTTENPRMQNLGTAKDVSCHRDLISPSPHCPMIESNSNRIIRLVVRLWRG